MIEQQVILPTRVAVQVVMQGIRIRFGRSLVTILGVFFGIAFLMSTLTVQVLKRGVAEEEQARKEGERMLNFLVAEMGPVKDHALGVLQRGPLNKAEWRLLSALKKKGLKQINWHSQNGVNDPEIPRVSGLTVNWTKSLAGLAEDARALLVMGEAAGSPDMDWNEIMRGAPGRLIALTRGDAPPANAGGIPFVRLGRALTPEEQAKAAAARKKEHFRNLWITIVSLLVTVIGISNAMLMSVTERFREIGTMKCLGALSAFIRKIFLIESSFMGIVGGLTGALAGALFTLLMYGFTYGFGLVVGSMDYPMLGLDLALAVLAGVALSIIAAIYPASIASRMLPADALRSNI